MASSINRTSDNWKDETENESSSSTRRRRPVPAPQPSGRSGGNVPLLTVWPSSRKTPRIVIVVVVLVPFFSVLGISTVSASSQASCDQLSFCPKHHLCPTQQYYQEPIGDSMKSTCTRIVESPTDDELGKVLDIIPLWFRLVVALGVPTTQAEAYRQENPPPIAGLHALRYWRDGRCDEAKFPPTWKFLLETVDTTCGSQVAKQLEAIVSPLESSQHQTGSTTLSTPTMTESGIPRSSNAPPDEGKDEGTSKIPLENLDNLTRHNLTEEDLNLLQGHTVEEGDYVWMELGVTGAGKSCLGNFILEEDNRFPESEIILKAKTQKASMGCTVFDKQRLCIVDTPGLGDTLRIGTHKSKAMDIANDASHLIMELTKMMMLTKTGISAFFIVVPLHHRDYAGLQQLLDFFDILGNFWNHSIVVLTHGTAIGRTKDEQYKTFTDLLQDPDCPPILIDLVKKVNDHFVIVEAKDWRSDTAYRNGVVRRLLSLSDDIFKQHGRYQDNLQSIGREAYEKAKLQYRNKFEDIDSPEAKEAIFQDTFSYVQETVLKLVRIKLADGEDVDKLKEMNELKEKMLEEIRKQRDQLHQEFLEEQKRRKEAEEEQKRIEEERRKEEQRRKQAEEEQRKAEERRRVAEEQKLKEQREKEEAQRKLEEYRKKPTFNERRITVEVYKSNIHKWKLVHSAEAVDVATGISAKAKNYKSKSGAKEHARENLKAILLDRGIIRKDNI